LGTDKTGIMGDIETDRDVGNTRRSLLPIILTIIETGELAMTEKRKPDNRSWFKTVIIMLGLIFVLWILEYIAFITYFFLGVIHFHEGKFDLAIADFTKAIQIKPNVADAYFFRGLAYKKKGEIDKAIIDFKKAKDIDNKSKIKKKIEQELNKPKEIVKH
jgi:tetratricopeptide (TPR) repeat protein